MTDWHVDQLFAPALDLGAVIFANRFSRLLVDPERFECDEQENMSSCGMGAVYTRTHDGQQLRSEPLPSSERERLLSAYYRPYARAFADLVGELLERHGGCLIIDAHSFATEPLPHEPVKESPRPDLCIGTDDFHTPRELVRRLRCHAEDRGLVARENTPFPGTYVPLRFLESDTRVASVMLETRRGLYCDERDGSKSVGFDATCEVVSELVAVAVAGWA